MTAKIAVLLVAVLSLAACDDVVEPGGPARPADPITTTTAAAPQPSKASCPGVVDDVKRAVHAPSVGSISVTPDCAKLTINTSLGTISKADARQLCEAAAKIAAEDSVTSVSVKGASGADLAASVQGSPCKETP